jgi:hypothetical protein
MDVKNQSGTGPPGAGMPTLRGRSETGAAPEPKLSKGAQLCGIGPGEARERRPQSGACQDGRARPRYHSQRSAPSALAQGGEPQCHAPDQEPTPDKE